MDSDTYGLNKGDTVRVKSGGPRMTVTGFTKGTDGKYHWAICVWQVGTNKHQQDSIPLVALVKDEAALVG